MLYYMNKKPEVKHVRSGVESYDLDENLVFEETEEDLLEQEEEIDRFTNRMSVQWGEEECKLRIAVFVSFVNNANALKFKQKIKKDRQSVV